MNDLTKNRIRRLLQQFGLRVLKYPFYKFPYDAANYPEVAAKPKPVIFDIGANIGQSSLWFRESFPQAEIYAFEPFAAVFQSLQANVQGQKVICHHAAMSDTEGQRSVPRVDNAECQVGSLRESGVGEVTEQLTLRTLDSFCRETGLPSIDILKSDTEGHDVSVLRGAEGFLRDGRIANVLVEATYDEADTGHSQMREIEALLLPQGYFLYSLYDLNHCHLDGRLQYFNALFKRKS